MALLLLTGASCVERPDLTHLRQYLLTSGVELVADTLCIDVANNIPQCPYFKSVDEEIVNTKAQIPANLHLLVEPSDPSSENRWSASKG